ncbi:MAG: glycogen debranching protein GlgX [Actinomycetales bacterium]
MARRLRVGGVSAPAEPPSPGLSRLGVHLRPGAGGETTVADAAIYAPHADAVEVCLFDRGPAHRAVEEHRVRLEHKVNGVFQGTVAQVRPGQRYGLRVHGPWDPAAGLRHNPAKLLIDPYAPALTGDIIWGQAVYSHSIDRFGHPVDGAGDTGGGRLIDHTDSFGSVPLGVLLPDLSPAPRGPGIRWEDTVVYEAHVKGLTIQHPQVPKPLRGTWAGLAHPAVLEHLSGLGITAIELLPVFAHGDEPRLVSQGLRNYWGYNHLSFFAPEAAYTTAAARAGGALSVVTEIIEAIQAIHQAGMEVILDVVYNHTCEGGAGGPTLSWRGLGEAAYYRMDGHGRCIDYTGTGNTVDFSQPAVVRMVLDSLRHWVTVYGVDGFRFDLAPALARGNGRIGREGYDPDHPFLVALRSDPVLSGVKLIAEPWDVGPHGWRTGEFPTPFAEWNDRYRDAVRGFWVADRRTLRHPETGPPRTDLSDLATRLAGSSDLFSRSASADGLERPAWATINFVTAHDGFTLADLVSYDRKHNEANGEDNRDGTDNNLSWNHGVEGRTDRVEVLADRHRTQMAALSTLVLSVGTPMLLGGMELGRTQSGNNNAYCQDNWISWVDWRLDTDRRASAPARQAMLEGIRELLRLRAAHPALRPTSRPDGRRLDDSGATDVAWFDPQGELMTVDKWHDTSLRTLQMALHGEPWQAETVLVVVHGGEEPIEITLPGAPLASSWVKEWDSAAFAAATWAPGDRPRRPRVQAGVPTTLAGCTVALFVARDAPDEDHSPASAAGDRLPR